MPERSEGPQRASQRVPEDDAQTVNAGAKSAALEVERNAPASYRSGRTNLSSIVEKPSENMAKSSLDGLSYTIPLHSEADYRGKSGGNRGRTRHNGPYTKSLHIRGSGIVLNDNRYYYRRRVPASLKATIGLKEFV